MNYKILSTLFLLSFTFNLSAQDIFPDETQNQKWEYVTWYFWGGHCENRVVLTGDRVNLCGDEFIEVFDCNEVEQNCLKMGYYRVENEKVFVRPKEYYWNGSELIDTVYCDNPAALMFDFNVEFSDTLDCLLGTQVFPNFWKVEEQLLEYEGEERKTLTMDYRPHINAPYFLREMNWIEGIGSDVYPFYSLTCIGDHCEWEQQLTKVTRGEELIYLDTFLNFGFPCTGWVTSEEEVKINENADLKLFPNPADSYFILDEKERSSNSVEVRIYNSIGQEVMIDNDYFLGERIDVGELKKGMHFVMISNERKRKTLKLLIE